MHTAPVTSDCYQRAAEALNRVGRAGTGEQIVAVAQVDALLAVSDVLAKLLIKVDELTDELREARAEQARQAAVPYRYDPPFG